MAESDATVRGAAFDVAEAGVGSRAMMGDSLPPRKRLLAGLKQNGLLSAASSPTAPSSLVTVHKSEGGTMGPEVVPEVRNPTSPAVTGEAKGGCTSCGALESSAWRRVKRNGVVQRLCNFCALLFNKNMNCPHCLVVYPAVKDPAIWLQCCRCQRSVHVECEKRSPSQAHTGPYVCRECVQLKKQKEQAKALLGAGATGCVGSVGLSFGVEGGNCASSAAAECSSPCSKKPRVSREPRSKSSDVEGDGTGVLEGMPINTKSGERKGGSLQESAAAAAAAAALAGRVAAAAKSVAAAKAATAVKAAAAATAALDAAALAARVEAKARSELRKRSVSCERTMTGVDCKPDASITYARKDMSEEPDVKIEGEEIPAVTTPTSVDDEELARQLHRAINSSPRISSGLTPLRRKPSGTPGAIANVSHSVISWPRVGLSSSGEPRPQTKLQQTRPRSICHKEVKRIDSRAVKVEANTSDGNCCNKFPEQPASSLASGNARQLGDLKAEPADSSTLTLVRQDSETTLRQHTTGAPLKVLLKLENDGVHGEAKVSLKLESDYVHGEAPQVFSGTEDNQDGRHSVANISQAAAMLDEVLLSEAEADKAAEKECSPKSQGSSNPDLKEDVSVSTSLIVEGDASHVHARQLGEEERQSAGKSGMTDVSMSSGVSASAQVATSSMESSKDHDASASVVPVEVEGPISRGGDSLQDVRAQENSGRLIGNASKLSEGKQHAKGTSDVENSSA